MRCVALFCLCLNLALYEELVVVKVSVVGSNTEVLAHVFGSESLFTCHESLIELLAVTCTDDIRACIAEELLNALCEITDRGGISLLDEEISGVSVIECETDEIDSLINYELGLAAELGTEIACKIDLPANWDELLAEYDDIKPTYHIY